MLSNKALHRFQDVPILLDLRIEIRGKEYKFFVRAPVSLLLGLE
jgi:hypothetical protein